MEDGLCVDSCDVGFYKASESMCQGKVLRGLQVKLKESTQFRDELFGTQTLLLNPVFVRNEILLLDLPL